MIIRCWGARGSIPVSGEEYVRYGGSTTCIEIRTKDDEIIIVDAGSGIRRLGNSLMAGRKGECNFLFTHAHWDHILGFPFFKPIYSENMRINVFGCSEAQESIQEIISQTMKGPYFPIDFHSIKSEINFHLACEEELDIGSVSIVPIALSHPNGGLGFRFSEDGKSFVFLTDNELAFKHPGGLEFEDYVGFSYDADVLLHDSEYRKEEYDDKRTWGHSCCEDALRLAMEAGVKRFGLFHHNPDRSDEDQDRIVEDCKRTIDVQGAETECFGVTENLEIML
jgi:phosphoribosyl 1,2-cyclic phosphodiesterase